LPQGRRDEPYASNRVVTRAGAVARRFADSSPPSQVEARSARGLSPGTRERASNKQIRAAEQTCAPHCAGFTKPKYWSEPKRLPFQRSVRFRAFAARAAELNVSTHGAVGRERRLLILFGDVRAVEPPALRLRAGRPAALLTPQTHDHGNSTRAQPTVRPPFDRSGLLDGSARRSAQPAQRNEVLALHVESCSPGLLRLAQR
jgi:hypothetical protein